MHPAFLMVTHSLLSRPAPLSEHVRTVQLPVAGCAVAEGTYCLMYGWGDTKGTILFYSISFQYSNIAELLVSILFLGQFSILKPEKCL